MIRRCSSYYTQMMDVEKKRDGIIATVLTEVEDLCNCGFGAGGIDAASSGFQGFKCHIPCKALQQCTCDSFRTNILQYTVGIRRCIYSSPRTNLWDRSRMYCRDSVPQWSRMPSSNWWWICTYYCWSGSLHCCSDYCVAGVDLHPHASMATQP